MPPHEPAREDRRLGRRRWCSYSCRRDSAGWTRRAGIQRSQQRDSQNV